MREMIENKPDGLFSINSFVPERHKTVGIAGEKTHAVFPLRPKLKRSGVEEKMILTVTLNPAVDKTYRTSELLCGRVNRMRSAVNLPGGKGINVSRILRQYGYEVAATGFLGGFPGEWIASCLENAGIRDEFIRIREDTRSSMNVVADNGFVTELLEPGPHISASSLHAFLERFSSLLPSCSMVALCGSAARGIPEDIYARLIREAAAMGKKVVLDSSGILLRQGIAASPCLIKPNWKGLEYVAGHRLESLAEVEGAARRLQKEGIAKVMVSLGEKGLLLAGEEGSFYAKAPKVKVENTVGCGDSVVASLLMSSLAQCGEEEMLRRAAALSAASAADFESGSVPVRLAEQLCGEVQVERL